MGGWCMGRGRRLCRFLPSRSPRTWALGPRPCPVASDENQPLPCLQVAMPSLKRSSVVAADGGSVLDDIRTRCCAEPAVLRCAVVACYAMLHAA